MAQPTARFAAVVFGMLIACFYSALNSYSLAAATDGEDVFHVEEARNRLAPLLAAVPANEVLGYVTDLPDGSASTGAFFAAQYAVAPRLLVRVGKDTRVTWVLGNFSQPGLFPEIATPLGLSPEKDFGRGAVLYRKAVR